MEPSSENAPELTDERSQTLGGFLALLGVERPTMRAAELIGRAGSLDAALKVGSEGSGAAWGDLAVAAEVLVAAWEVVDLAQRERIARVPLNPRDPGLHEYLKTRIGRSQSEVVLALLADEEGGFIAEVELARGEADQVHVSARHVMGEMLRRGAAQFLLAHNHPSGLCAPSRADCDTTARIASLAGQLGIAALGHLVVTRDATCSIEVEVD